MVDVIITAGEEVNGPGKVLSAFLSPCHQNQNPLLTSLYIHNKHMAHVNSIEMLTIYLILVSMILP